MGYERDAEMIAEVVLRRDPSFAPIDPRDCAAKLQDMQAAARRDDRDAFLLAAMRVAALARNGHSRIIPNAAIEVAAHRIVMHDGQPVLVCDGVAKRIIAINGQDPARLMSSWSELLAGTPARQRVLSGLMLAWPAALAVAGLDPLHLQYKLEDGRTLESLRSETVDALPLYPVSDPGGLDPAVDDFALSRGRMVQWQGGIWRIRINRMIDVAEADFDAVVQEVRAHAGAGIVVDLRGNTGGNYRLSRPLLNWLADEWHGERCAVLVNNYTFSAAIVMAVLMKHRLAARSAIFGADVGDSLQFYAEGGTITLPQSGGLFRYSTAWHDWQTGQADATTPAAIAAEMVGIGSLDIRAVPEADQMHAAVEFAKGES